MLYYLLPLTVQSNNTIAEVPAIGTRQYDRPLRTETAGDDPLTIMDEEPHKLMIFKDGRYWPMGMEMNGEMLLETGGAGDGDGRYRIRLG